MHMAILTEGFNELQTAMLATDLQTPLRFQTQGHAP